MLLIHRSERADPLVAALGDVLATPPADPFAPEVVAIANPGIERWLAQQLSHVLGAVDGDGVCANVRFPRLNDVLDDAVAAADERYANAVDNWSAERAVWPLMTIIDETARSAPWAAMLAVHLGLEPGGQERGRRFAVAAKLARLFVGYGRARPDMLRAWHAGRDDQGDGTPLPADLRWQAQLWRLLRTHLGPSPAELLDDACARLRATASSLPERFSIFGITRLDPARIAVLDALAAHHAIHVWLSHPSPMLWDEVQRSDRQSGRRADAPPDLVRNPLLASLSRDIRELQQLLPPADDVYHPVNTRPGTLLGRLQQQLADDATGADRPLLDGDDRSIRVHACHGPARQVEVVREVILGLLRDDPTLEPRDILIMCPDVETFAPLIAATFGQADDGPDGARAGDDDGRHPAARLRVRLADRSLRQTNPLLRLLGRLLDLAAARVTATQVLDLADEPAVRARFRFGDDDIEQLRDWAGAANARWGLDAAHRAPYHLELVNQGTWRAAIDRLLLGVAMEEDERWLGSVLPLDDVGSGAIDLAGRLAELLDRLDHALRTLEQRHTVPRWAALLGELVVALGEPAQPWHEVQLRTELADLAAAAGDSGVELGRTDLAALVDTRMAGRPTRASFRTGTLTVCTLVPMRSVPHRVVCLLGLDDGAFPRHAVTDGDEVLARDPRTGERDVRSEDRQLFLDAICAAREHLVIAYTGADPRSGAEVPPCVPLGELLDTLDATARSPAGGPVREHVVVRQPLHTFDARNFTPHALGTPDPFSFDPAGLAGARSATGARSAPRNPFAGVLDAAPREDVVALDDLVRFVTNPMREFLKQRLQISTWQDDDEPADALPVDVNGLAEWAIGSRVLHARLAGVSVETCRGMEERRGDLPPGDLGLRALTEIGRTVEALVAACAAERTAAAARSVDMAVPLPDGRVLAGTVPGLHGSTLLDVTYSTLGPRQRLEVWVRYLALAATPDGAGLQAVCVGKYRRDARRKVVRGVDPADAVELLADLVELRDAGLRVPLPLPPKTSAAYAERRHSGQDVDDALAAALSRWQDGRYPGECSDAAHELVFGGTVTLETLVGFNPGSREELRFEALARRLWVPLLTAEASP